MPAVCKKENMNDFDDQKDELVNDVCDDLDADFHRALDFDNHVDELRHKQWVDPGPGVEYHEWMKREVDKQLGPGLPYWPKRSGTIYKQHNKDKALD
jgi:hypothetical protein